jgi:hypothetical protein
MGKSKPKWSMGFGCAENGSQRCPTKAVRNLLASAWLPSPSTMTRASVCSLPERGMFYREQTLRFGLGGFIPVSQRKKLETDA